MLDLVSESLVVIFKYCFLSGSSLIPYIKPVLDVNLDRTHAELPMSNFGVCCNVLFKSVCLEYIFTVGKVYVYLHPHTYSHN